MADILRLEANKRLKKLEFPLQQSEFSIQTRFGPEKRKFLLLGIINSNQPGSTCHLVNVQKAVSTVGEVALRVNILRVTCPSPSSQLHCTLEKQRQRQWNLLCLQQDCDSQSQFTQRIAKLLFLPVIWVRMKSLPQDIFEQGKVWGQVGEV